MTPEEDWKRVQEIGALCQQLLEIVDRIEQLEARLSYLEDKLNA